MFPTIGFLDRCFSGRNIWYSNISHILDIKNHTMLRCNPKIRCIYVADIVRLRLVFLGHSPHHLEKEGQVVGFQGRRREDASEFFPALSGNNSMQTLAIYKLVAILRQLQLKLAYNKTGEQEDKTVMGMVIRGVGLLLARPERCRLSLGHSSVRWRMWGALRNGVGSLGPGLVGVGAPMR